MVLDSCCTLLSSRPGPGRTGKEAGGMAGGAAGDAGGVSSLGCALSIGSQRSVEDPGAVTCGSSTCMLICESSRQSVLPRRGSVCGSVRSVGLQRNQHRESIPWSFGSMAWRTSTCHPLARMCVSTLLERCWALHQGIRVSGPIAAAF